MDDLSTFLASKQPTMKFILDDADVAATFHDPIEWERHKYRLKLLQQQVDQAVADGRISHVIRTWTPNGTIVHLVK